MPTKKTLELIQECEKQGDSLLISLGRLLYENIQAGTIAYYFDPDDPALMAQAKRLIRDVVVEKISDRKEKLSLSKTSRRISPVKAPVKIIAEAPKAKSVMRPVVAKSIARKTVSKAPKNAVMAVLKGVTNVIMSEFKGPDAAPVHHGGSVHSPTHQKSSEERGAPAASEATVREQPRSSGTLRRGQLESYTQLNVALHVAANKLLDVQKDLNDCLSAGLLHVTGERTKAYQEAADKKIQQITLLLGKKREEIRHIMDTKRKFFAENPEATLWKEEEGFLKQVEQDVNQTTRRVDELIEEVVGLFKNIGEGFEKDLEQARLARKQERVSVASTPVRSSWTDFLTGGPAQNSSSEEILDEAGEETVSEETVIEESFVNQEHIDAGEVGDYGLLETAGRKLRSESTSDEEKLAVLHTLFRNAPSRAVPFLYELTREADGFFQRKLLSLLTQLDYPTMVDLYRRFVTDANSSLRLQGVMGLVKLDSDEAKNVIVSAIRDQDAHVRRFIVNHLDHTAGDPEATAIARLAADSDEGVARIAIRKLGIMANHFAFVSLVPRLESLSMKVCKEAIDALVSMTGTDQGYNYAASPVERRRQAKVWNALAKESYIKPRLLRELREQYMGEGKSNQPKTPKLSVEDIQKKGLRAVKNKVVDSVRT
ncbi:MAG: HEAT repeat domain-containing protein [Candidatus Omnitrophica bacterium]|nr:HEAT repeat domain-containing protein [Candidatus Omnitrophota bacterium]